ncbi:hypothetical protein BLA39750_00861 [Burkholderia lata]|uniref:Uncharacterized protein n=1 Tax=Burkholderia lata (strain ATCC 17760 / DSM 23089 / LMG 22485 / NCIMB 9086 / R18194 / 383) TaxID=482957 RepID=A0A6P2V5V9_BURL3|nr:hypothetical protein BLA39750_00861 [Burkholderia lata]
MPLYRFSAEVTKVFHFIHVAITLGAILFFPLYRIGKVLDFHFKGAKKNPTLDKLESAYLFTLYGTLLQEFGKQTAALMRRSRLSPVITIVGWTVVVWVSVELYLFHRISLSSTLTQRYLYLLPFLIGLGLIDFAATYHVAKLAARGRIALALLFSLVVPYVSLLISEAFVATAILPVKEPVRFFFEFFPNRLLNVFKDMIYGGISISSVAYGTKLSGLTFALPAAVVSSFFMVSAILLAVLSTPLLRPVMNYLAARVLRPDEKEIHYKLSYVVWVILTMVLSAVVCAVSIS